MQIDLGPAISRSGEGAVPDYRLFHFECGHIVAARLVKASDDGTAIEEGRRLAGDAVAELWRGDVKIKKFDAPPR